MLEKLLEENPSLIFFSSGAEWSQLYVGEWLLPGSANDVVQAGKQHVFGSGSGDREGAAGLKWCIWPHDSMDKEISGRLCNRSVCLWLTKAAQVPLANHCF